LLLGASRNQVKFAVKQLIANQQADRKVFGDIDTLFLFYFTGHGLDGRILLDDGALSAEELGEFFSAVDADFSIGVFDACFSGSLDNALLVSKGIRSAPGLNLFRELPEEVLSAEGRIWYVSSGSNQESFEDERLGGVFTHFFIEALENGDVHGPGITLENVWQYARSHTVEYTAERKRIQVPEQYIANLRTNAPIYFSYVKNRTATLVLSRQLRGRFALSYKMGNLTEVIDKPGGKELVLAVYPGDARLVLVDGEDNIYSQNISLRSGEKLMLGEMTEQTPSPRLGEQADTLFKKGVGIERSVRASRIREGLSIVIGAGYNYGFTHEKMVQARHGISIPIRLDIGHAYFGGALKYGIDKRVFPDWAFLLHEIDGRLFAGYAANFSAFRVGAGAVLEAGVFFQRYENGEQRNGARLRPLLELSVFHRASSVLHGALSANIGAVHGPGIGAVSDNLWYFSADVGATLYWRVY
jgi:hypothetical protein